MSRTVAEWLALGDDLPLELAKVLREKPYRHSWESNPNHWRCSRCKGECELVATPKYCPIPNPIDVEDLGGALQRFRSFARNELFEPMLDIARPHQPNGEFSGMPVDRMWEIAEQYCLYEATAQELWIICAMSKEPDDAEV